MFFLLYVKVLSNGFWSHLNYSLFSFPGSSLGVQVCMLLIHSFLHVGLSIWLMYIYLSRLWNTLRGSEWHIFTLMEKRETHIPPLSSEARTECEHGERCWGGRRGALYHQTVGGERGDCNCEESKEIGVISSRSVLVNEN